MGSHLGKYVIGYGSGDLPAFTLVANCENLKTVPGTDLIPLSGSTGSTHTSSGLLTELNSTNAYLITCECLQNELHASKSAVN